MEKQIITDTLWKELEEKSKNMFFWVKFLIGEDEIIIDKKISKDKFKYVVFINGVMSGVETEENQIKYWFEKKIMMKQEHKKFYLGMAKLHKGEEKKKYQELSKQTVLRTYLIPSFGSFKALKSAYKKRHEEIFLLETGNFHG